MSATVNDRDVALQATTPRLVTLTLPANVVLGVGAVLTPMVANNAITVPVSTAHATFAGLDTPAWQTVATLSVTTPDVAAPILVAYCALQTYLALLPNQAGFNTSTRIKLTQAGLTTTIYDSGECTGAYNIMPSIQIKVPGFAGLSVVTVEWLGGVIGSGVSATSIGIRLGNLSATGLQK